MISANIISVFCRNIGYLAAMDPPNTLPECNTPASPPLLGSPAGLPPVVYEHLPGWYRVATLPQPGLTQPARTDVPSAPKDVGLGDAVERVIRGLKDLEVHPKKVDEIGRAVERSRQDRAVSGPTRVRGMFDA